MNKSGGSSSSTGGPSSSSSNALTFAAAPSAAGNNNNNNMLNKMNNNGGNAKHGHGHVRRHSNNTYNTQALPKLPGSPSRYCMSDVVPQVRRQGGQQQQRELQREQKMQQQQQQQHHHQQQYQNQGQREPVAPYRPFPIVSFNHLSREVLDYELSRDFYCGVLGFIEIPRPAFENEGVWLYGFGLSLHLIKSRYPQKRLLLKGRRIEHFEEALPNVDHMAFITSNLKEVEKQLQEHSVFYKRFGSHKTNIHQIFLFDPDGNVIEISNCAPPVGETTCPRVVGMGGPESPQSRL